MSPYLAEFVGTTILVLLGNGVVANVLLTKTKGHDGGWIVITFGWGLAVAVAVYSVARISGAHINPAVTVSLASIGSFEWTKVPGYILAQMAGGIFGSFLVYLTYLAHWKETEDPALKLACHSTAPAIRKFGPAFLTEAIGTAMLVFGVLAFGKIALGVDTSEAAWAAVVDTWFGPILVGVIVLSIGLSLGGPTGYAINPARDLGPRIAHAILPIPGKGSSDWQYSWIPVLAPIVGGIIGAQLFVLLRL
ncbi:MAG: MIP/aquaporin family protein [Verrucomicrobiota bacterium]